MAERGILIAFEGIDGTGKSTQIALLADYLAAKGYRVAATREPTDGPYGRKIRSLFTKRCHLTAEEELALFMADRREHVRELILPALAEGKVVLTDRYYLSTAAYQGALGHDPARIIVENEKFAPLPDLVILLELTPAESVHRIKNLRGESLNDFEREDGLAAVAAIFAGFAMDNIARIDAAASPVEVHRKIVAKVDEMLAAGKDSA
ncbi:MAG: dTMP kinase [Desulfurivibrionaceae bacterium]|nr:dTMP kinase [Desulfobulbales bacterium]MDT8335543.1 dTMP kinase [Desulfurivibrionaceae bacterium]